MNTYFKCTWLRCRWGRGEKTTSKRMSKISLYSQCSSNCWAWEKDCCYRCSWQICPVHPFTLFVALPKSLHLSASHILFWPQSPLGQCSGHIFQKCSHIDSSSELHACGQKQSKKTVGIAVQRLPPNLHIFATLQGKSNCRAAMAQQGGKAGNGNVRASADSTADIAGERRKCREFLRMIWKHSNSNSQIRRVEVLWISGSR